MSSDYLWLILAIGMTGMFVFGLLMGWLLE